MDLKYMQSKQAARWAGSNNADAVLAENAAHRKSQPGAVGRGTPRRHANLTPQRSGAASARAPALPASSSTSSAVHLPLEKLLDHREQSNSTFAPSSQILGRSESTSTGAWSAEMHSPMIFPTNKPSSKADAAVLDSWITQVLDRYAERMAAGLEETTSMTESVDQLVPTLSIGLHELTRQVSKQCAERGVVLEKIWRTYVELFDRALAETRALLRFHKARTQRVSEELARTEQELAVLKGKHPEQIKKLSNTLSSKFMQRHEDLENQLTKMRDDNASMQQVIQKERHSTNTWFPLFKTYKDSSYGRALLETNAELPSTTTPESRIAADFKRILSAMPMDARRRVGFFVSSLLGIRGTEMVEHPQTMESLTERKEHNIWKIDLLERRVQELRGEIPMKSTSTLSRWEATERK